MLLFKVDVDCVCGDLVTPWLRRYEYMTGESIAKENLTNYHFSKHVKFPRVLQDILADTDLYDEVVPEPGALAGVNKLRDSFDARIVYVTRCERNQFDQKREWLTNYGFMTNPADYVGAIDKTLVACDLVIDDFEGNFGPYDKVKILFGQPWNRSASTMQNLVNRYGTTVDRMDGWDHLDDYEIEWIRDSVTRGMWYAA